MLGVHAVPGEPGHVELTGPGLSDAARAVEVHFGPRTRARVVRRTQHGVVCAVPPSEYAGIGYATRVRLRVRVQRPHGRRGGWTDAVFANASRAWWTYAATVPPTRVANVATALVWRSGDAQLLRVLRLFADRLGRDWRIQLFVYPDVAPAFRDDAFVAAELESGRLEITPRARLSSVQLARAQLDPAYWEPVHGDRILVVQSDAVPCSHTPYRISDFYNYSYVGAPWCYFSVRGGNSGLSLRNKTTIINMLRDHKDVFDAYLANPAFVMEDVAICLSFLSCLSLYPYSSCHHTHTHACGSLHRRGGHQVQPRLCTQGRGPQVQCRDAVLADPVGRAPAVVRHPRARLGRAPQVVSGDQDHPPQAVQAPQLWEVCTRGVML